MSFKIDVSQIVGNYAEMYVSHYLIKKGYRVFKNQTSDGTDLIAMNKKLIKIQVKASTLMKIAANHKGYCFQIRRKRSNEIYDVDYFAFCCMNTDKLNVDKLYFIPIKEIIDLKSKTLNIKFGKTKWDEYANFI